MKKTFHKIKCIAVSLVIFGAIAACVWKYQPFPKNDSIIESSVAGESQSEQEQQTQFDAFTMQIFRNEMLKDGMLLHYSLLHPERYQIKDAKATLGHISVTDLQEHILTCENWMASLEKFAYNKLSKEQQLTYDCLKFILENELSEADNIEYTRELGPTTGVQAQLLVLLAEFRIETKEDVERYLKMVEAVPEYLAEVEAFEEKKAEDGLFMADSTADAICNQCRDFTAAPEECYLLGITEHKINQISKLSAGEKKRYLHDNREAVLKKLIPAYENLVVVLEKLKGDQNNQGGLCAFEDGKKYYEKELRRITGSSRSIADIRELLEKQIENSLKKISEIMSESPDSYYDARKVKYPCENPEETIQFLCEKMQMDFYPLEEDIQCDVKYIDKSLEESLSPAFYLMPAIDDYSQNCIYLNQSGKYDLSRIYPTLAHESFPGHLYQNVSFLASKPSPLRCLMNFGGYTEGWGIYAELYSYSVSGLDENVVHILQENTISTLCLHAKIDLMVNYYGWSQKKVCGYLSTYGFEEESGRQIYCSVIAEPLEYMKYCLGYLEIAQMRKNAQELLGDQFVLKEFHRFFLELGPVPFDIARDRMRIWVKNV